MPTKAALTWQDRLFRLIRPVPGRAASLQHYTRETEGVMTRFHLRTEPDGGGMLLANAASACLLSPSGVVMAEGILAGRPNDRIVQDLATHFAGVSPFQAVTHLRELRDLIERLASPDDNYPITNLADPEVAPHVRRLGAPFRAELPAMEPDQAFPLLKKLWEAGVPHVCFLAPTGVDPGRLVQLVERAEDLGMICGVRGRASDFGDEATIHALAQAGVDHLNCYYCLPEEAHDALFGEADHGASRAALRRASEEEVCPVAQVPVLTATAPMLEETFEDLAAQGVRNLSFFAVAEVDDLEEEVLSARELPAVAGRIEEAATLGEVRFLWEVPIRRRPEKSLAAQVSAGPRAAGDVSIRVEADGSVLPPRGPWESAGNLLLDSWTEIWNHPAFRTYREIVEAPTRCDICPGLAICAAACPADPQGWAEDSGAEV